jgi:RNA 2',3'-cyclic 3'-phosphodiesterase
MAIVRAFIALPLSADVQRGIAVVQTELKDSQADVKWDTSDKFHITLKFLGDIDVEQAPLIARELEKSIGTSPAFDLTFFKLGAFPDIERPRVIWIGTQESEQVPQLKKHVERICEKFGFAKEDRPFHAHVTLGRVKGSRDLGRLTAKLKSITFKPLTARCSEIRIVRSELKPTGSVYTLLNSIPLAS